MSAADTITDACHVRVTVTAPGRRWCGSPGRRVVLSTRALCGADVTAYDSTERDFGRLLSDPHWSARACARCAEILSARMAKEGK